MSPQSNNSNKTHCAILFVIAILIISILTTTTTAANYEPEQIIISLTGRKSKTHAVTWTTGSSTNSDKSYTTSPKPILLYGTSPNDLSTKITGSTKRMDKEGYVADIHICEFGDLPKGTRIYYAVGDSNYPHGRSSVRQFDTSQIKTYAVYGDYGYDGMDYSYETLTQYAHDGVFQSVFHLGDIGYNLDHQNGLIGDQFMRKIEPIASHVPYMTIPGNHEKHGNFGHYKYRYRAQNVAGKQSSSDSQFYYSFNQELVHFIFFDTEVYLNPLNTEQQRDQLRWLEQDLITANKPENRKSFPWIVSMGHKCDWHEDVDYSKFSTLLHNYGVDVHICGHQHNYQRLFPGYAAKYIENFQDLHTHVNPKQMIQIVVGSPGLPGIGSHTCPYPDALAHNLFTYGFGLFQVVNSTHLTFDFVQTVNPTTLAEEDDDFGRANLAMDMYGGGGMVDNTKLSSKRHIDQKIFKIKNQMLQETYSKTHRTAPHSSISGAIQDHLTLIQTNHGKRKAIQPTELKDHFDQITNYNQFISATEKSQLSLQSRVYGEYNAERAILEYAMKKKQQQIEDQRQELNLLGESYHPSTSNMIDDKDLDEVIAELDQRLNTSMSLYSLFDQHSFNYQSLSSPSSSSTGMASQDDILGENTHSWTYYDEYNQEQIKYQVIHRFSPNKRTSHEE